MDNILDKFDNFLGNFNNQKFCLFQFIMSVFFDKLIFFPPVASNKETLSIP